MIYLGIDPGMQGALVAVDPNGVVLDYRKMPRTGGSTGPLDLFTLWSWLYEIRRVGGSASAAILEDMQHHPGGKQSKGSLMTMARNHGRIEGLLMAQGWRYQLTAPTRWQKVMHGGCSEAGDTKAKSVLACRRLLPDLDLTPGKKRKPDDNLADAGLLALYCRRVMGQG